MQKPDDVIAMFAALLNFQAAAQVKEKVNGSI